MMAETVKVKSGFVAAPTYDHEARTIEIELGGVAYTIQGASKDLFDSLASAPSPGAFFNKSVRGTYKVVRKG